MSLESILTKLDYEENHLSTIQHFESVFTKENFDVLLDYQK